MYPSSLANNFRCLCLLILSSLIGSLAWAQATASYPNKPVTLVVTYPPGGGADAMARLLAPKMAEALGQNVLVENKPGAGGQIGAAAVAKAAPDGYTLMLDASSFAVNPSLYPKLPYDTLKAFKPIGVVALFPNVVLVNSNFSAQSVSDLIAIAKEAKIRSLMPHRATARLSIWQARYSSRRPVWIWFMCLTKAAARPSMMWSVGKFHCFSATWPRRCSMYKVENYALWP